MNPGALEAVLRVVTARRQAAEGGLAEAERRRAELARARAEVRADLAALAPARDAGEVRLLSRWQEQLRHRDRALAERLGEAEAACAPLRQALARAAGEETAVADLLAAARREVRRKAVEKAEDEVALAWQASRAAGRGGPGRVALPQPPSRMRGVARPPWSGPPSSGPPSSGPPDPMASGSPASPGTA